MRNTFINQKGQDYHKNFQRYTAEARVWKANFKHEGSIDDGGPYRESMEEISKELTCGVLTLLVPTVNQKRQHGECQECFIFNPAANSQKELEMYDFFGTLMGFATRTGQCFNIDMHPMIWKTIVGQPLDYEFDLRSSDKYAYQFLNKIIQHAKEFTDDEEFQASIQNQDFTIFTDGVSDYEVCPGGAGKPVTL